MLNVKVLKTIVNDGILYEIVEKPETIYAGKLESSDTNKGEPDIKSILGGYREISSKITGAVDEAWWLGISMNYGNDKVPASYMFALEVNTDEQPDGVDVYKMPASFYIRMRKDDNNALKQLGKENCQSYELFSLIFDTMKKYHYDFGNCGEIECDFSKDVKIGYVYVSIAANH